MADSQMRVALIELGAGVRADFLQTLAAWHGDWLPPAHVTHQDWLALDDLEQALAPFGDLPGLHRFLTAGFLPAAEVADAAEVDSAASGRGDAGAGRVPAPTVLPEARPGAARAPHRASAAPGIVNTPVTVPASSPQSGELRALAQPWQTDGAPASAAAESSPPAQMAAPTRVGELRALVQGLTVDAGLPSRPAGAADAPHPAITQPEMPAPARVGGLRDLAQRLPVDGSLSVRQGAQQEVDAPDAPPWMTASDQRMDGASPAQTSHGEATTPATLSPLALPASMAPTAPMAHAAHGQLPGAAPLAALPPVYAAPPQLDSLMDALAREIVRDYHRYYGA